jgi:hypothetical protein
MCETPVLAADTARSIESDDCCTARPSRIRLRRLDALVAAELRSDFNAICDSNPVFALRTSGKADPCGVGPSALDRCPD